MNNTDEDITETQKKQFLHARQKRNLAVGFALVGFIIMIYFVTIFKLGSQLFI